MTPERIEQLRKRYERWSMGGVRDAVIVECLDEIERLRELLSSSDDGEPITAEWLESAGLLGEHDLQGGLRLCVHCDCSVIVEYSSSGWYREFAAYELDVATRGDARRLAAMFGIKLREGDDQLLRTLCQTYFGSVGAMSPNRYGERVGMIAKLIGVECDESFRERVHGILKTLAFPLD